MCRHESNKNAVIHAASINLFNAFESIVVPYVEAFLVRGAMQDFVVYHHHLTPYLSLHFTCHAIKLRYYFLLAVKEDMKV